MNNDSLTDKRQFHRIFYHGLATITAGSATYPCEIIDISLKGCLLRFEQPWLEDPTQPCTFCLRLSNEIRIEMDLLLTHNLGNEAGFKCQHIDINSITELKRMVELNLGSSELLERDMQALIASFN